MQNIGYPQVLMEEEVDKSDFELNKGLKIFMRAKKNNLFIYKNIQTSPG